MPLRTLGMAEAAFDNALAVGDVVEARFTNNNRRLVCRARVTKLNRLTARVESLEDGVNGWPAGHEFVIQRFESPLWSVNNGLFPTQPARDFSSTNLAFKGRA